MTIHARSAGVEFRHVSRRYGTVLAVNDVSFTVEAGNLVTLLGPSGCGKTTTLRLIAGLEMASAGSIWIGGRDVTALSATDRNVTMVFQSYALFPHMTVVENVAYGLRIAGVSRQQAEGRASEGLALVGLAGYERRMPAELSGGQQQRVAVARALVLEPEVLLFDEPLSNLDAKLRRKMREDIRELQQGLGLTAVYVTHDQEEALAVSDRIIVMNRAVIAQQGRPDELYRHPADRFVADFIGGANLVEGAVIGREQGSVLVRIGQVQISLPDRGEPCGEVTVAIRPTAISLAKEPGVETLPVTVRKATYLGSHIEYSLTSEFGELLAVGPDMGQPVLPGTTAFAGLTPRGVALVGR